MLFRNAELVDAQGWRVFRLFLAELDDEQLAAVSDDFIKEVMTRQACASRSARLFFSSLVPADLQKACDQIITEYEARSEELNL